MRQRNVVRSWMPLLAVAALGACGDDTTSGSNGSNSGTTDTGGGANGDIVFGDTAGGDGAGGIDGQTADSGAADSGSLDTGALDTGAVDTGDQDTGEGDTGTMDTGPIDTGSVDTGAVDTEVPDTGSVDAGDPDTTPPDGAGVDTGDGGGSADGAGDVVAPPGSCKDRCGKYDSAASCQCDSGCAGFGDCCADLAQVCGCVGDDCCAKDADCDDSLACTKDKCGSDGKCAHDINSSACAVDGACYMTGESPASNACLVCDPAKSNKAFDAKVGKACDDGSACTTADACDATGACKGSPKADCCKVDADCVGSEPCKVGTCDAKAGTCSFAPKANCCAEGLCCDLAAQALKPAGTSCGGTAVAVEYQCDGLAVQKRQAFEGCDGVDAAKCSKDSKFHAWTPWTTVSTCAEGQTCTFEAKDKPPICKAQGGGKTCAKVADCDDANPCTADSCDAGVCVNAAKAGCCAFDSECNDGNPCTLDACTGNVCANTAKICSAPSDCETAACDAKTGACVASVKTGFCKIGSGCVASGAKDPADSCQVCTPSASSTGWSLTSTCACQEGVCCDAKAGKILTTATKCDDAVQATEYQCSEDGKQLQQRQAFRGCTGKSNTCSTSKSYFAWSTWTKVQDCATGTVCEVSDPTVKGACVKTGGGAVCTAGSTCCTAQGSYATKGTACETSKVVATESKCSGPEKGAKLQERTATAGCTGASATCSTASANLVWSAWKDTKTCASTETCALVDGKATCQKAGVCDPSATCCTAQGTYAAQGTKCGAQVLGTQWQCSSESKGAKVQKRDAYGGCNGKATGCSFAYEDLHFGAWADSKTCESNAYCSVDADGKPGCVVPPTVDCKASDKWEGEESALGSKSIGAFKDSDPALILTPQPLLGGATDKDYFTYSIQDATNTTNPRVHIEWSAPGAVTVCGYYACDKGKNGKDCEPVKCPADAAPFEYGEVSGTKPNGCCKLAQKGTLDFSVSAAGTLDESGKVFFNIKNASPFCQNVAVKLAFGSNLATVCDPATACCTDAGQWAAKGTACGKTVLKTEYKCAGSKAGDDMLKREALAGCTGSGSTCSTSTTNQVWGEWKVATDCKTSEICSVPDPTKAGVCVAGNDLVCKAADKYEGPTSTATSFDLGSFKDTAGAIVLKPNVHLGAGDDKDWFKYRINDDANLSDPVVDIEWTAADAVTVCAYYQCLNGDDGKDCAAVTCPEGATPFFNSAVSATSPNGCCMTGKKGDLWFYPDAPGLFNTDETGWVYWNIKNAAPICQYAVVKLLFDGSDVACGDGVCDAGEATSCKTDCGSCGGKCGAAYDSKASCQCDAACATVGDCCWDKPLLCGG